MIEAGIDGDAVQPGVKGRGGCKAFKSLEGLYESVLSGIVGVIPVFQHVTAQVVYPVLVFMHERPEGGRVAALEMFNNLVVIHCPVLADLQSQIKNRGDACVTPAIGIE